MNRPSLAIAFLALAAIGACILPGCMGVMRDSAYSPADFESVTQQSGLSDAALPPVAADQPRPTEFGDRRIVYTGQFVVVAEDVSVAMERLRAYAAQQGGYMSSMADNVMTIRVPAGQFDAAVAKLRELGRIERQSISAVDVTDEYADIEIRLANATAAMERYQQLLSDAKDAETVLAIERELERLRGEIASLSGRLARLKNSVTFATLTVEFRPMAQRSGPRVRLPFYWIGRLGLDNLLDMD